MLRGPKGMQKLNGVTHHLGKGLENRRFTLIGDPDYISESEKAELIEKARKERLSKPKPKSTLTYPGFMGTPSELPGMKRKRA